MRTIATLFLFASLGCATADAQPLAPPDTYALPDTYVPPDTFLPPERPDQITVDQIRGALETGQPAAAPGILGDVLEVIRQRGSILDGSVLDPENEDPLKMDERATPKRDAGVETSISPPIPSSVNVAESLLRSARLLESIPGGDEERRVLIRQMRIQATRLLRQMYPR